MLGVGVLLSLSRPPGVRGVGGRKVQVLGDHPPNEVDQVIGGHQVPRLSGQQVALVHFPGPEELLA